MKFLAALCVLVVGASAQLGPSGLIDPSGVNRQFTHDYASSIVLIGPSGAVTSTGENLQLTAEQAALHTAVPYTPMPVSNYVMQGAFGPSGIVYPSGENVQFTSAQADNIVLIGPSGVVTADGNNLQLNDQGVPSRKKRELLGPSGYINFEHGLKRHLPRGVYIVLKGPSGMVFSDGSNFQFPE